jgi:hypothetical protein
MSTEKNQRIALAVCLAHGSLFSRHRSDSFVVGRPGPSFPGTRKIPARAVTALERRGLVAIQNTARGQRARLTPQGEATAQQILAARVRP